MSDLDRRVRAGDMGPESLRPVQASGGGRRSRVQARYQDGPAASPQEPAASEAMQGIAQQGVAGSGSPLPHLDQIQRSFGDHDVSGVRAHVGGQAAAAAESMGAAGYATGNDVALRDASSLHTVAHEAAHVVQQRGGVHLKGGVGQAGDEYERNADAVADRVVRGESAEDLLAPYAAGGGAVAGAATQHKAIQLFREISGEDDRSPWNRISDDGRMAVVDHEAEAWAEPDMIARSNAVLAENRSKATIAKVGDLMKVQGATRTHYMTKFRMEDRDASWSRRHFGNPETDLIDDCGSANQQMQGSETVNGRSFLAANTNGGTNQEFSSKPSTYKKDDNQKGGIVSTTEQLSGEIYQRIMLREFGKTLTREDALAEWAGMTDAQREMLSRKYGINQFAVPKVGQGITKGSERDMPGADMKGFNFHFALNLMQAGEDYMTVEDFRDSGTNYYFKMYGPASKKQSFTEDADNQVTDKQSTAMVVVHPHLLDGKLNTSVRLLHSKTRAPGVTLEKGTEINSLQRGDREHEIEVLSGPQTGARGWIPATAFTNT
jgi:hypothetical protein